MSWLSKKWKKVKSAVKKIDPTRTKIGKAVKRGVAWATAPMRIATQGVIKLAAKTGLKPLKWVDKKVNSSDKTFGWNTTVKDATKQFEIGAAAGLAIASGKGLSGIAGAVLGKDKKEETPKLESSKDGQTVDKGTSNKKLFIFAGVGVAIAAIVVYLWD